MRLTDRKLQAIARAAVREMNPKYIECEFGATIVDDEPVVCLLVHYDICGHPFTKKVLLPKDEPGNASDDDGRGEQ